MSQEEVETFADAIVEDTTNKKGPYERTSVFTFTGNLPQKNVLEKVTPAFVGIKTHGEFPVELMKTKRKGGENAEKGEKINLTTIDFKTIVDPSVKHVRLGWLFFVFPGLAALHTSATSKQLIDNFQNELLEVIESQNKMTNEVFIDTIQKLQYQYLFIYIRVIIPELIQLFEGAIDDCERLWKSEIAGDVTTEESELNKKDIAEITSEFHSYMEAMTDYHNILHALMFEPQDLIRFATWDNYDPNCPPIPIKKFLTSRTLLEGAQNNDWDITIQSLPPITTGNLTPDVASIENSKVVASVFTGAKLQTVLPDFVCGPGCIPQGDNGDMFIMSDDLLREIYKRYSLGILIDSTCAHTRYQYKKGTYSVVDQKEVNQLQKQFKSLDRISIKLTDDQAHSIAVIAQNAFIRDEDLISLLARSHDLVSVMIPKIKSENKNKNFTAPEQKFMALYENALKTSEELKTLILAAKAEHRVYNTGAAAATGAATATHVDAREGDMILSAADELGGSNHKRSKRRKHGSKKKIKNKAKKTKKRCKKRTKRRIRK